jgi:hypothetical protein
VCQIVGAELDQEVQRRRQTGLRVPGVAVRLMLFLSIAAFAQGYLPRGGTATSWGFSIGCWFKDMISDPADRSAIRLTEGLLVLECGSQCEPYGVRI